MIKVPEISQAISSCMDVDEGEDDEEIYDDVENYSLAADEFMEGKRE